MGRRARRGKSCQAEGGEENEAHVDICGHKKAPKKTMDHGQRFAKQETERGTRDWVEGRLGETKTTDFDTKEDSCRKKNGIKVYFDADCRKKWMARDARGLGRDVMEGRAVAQGRRGVSEVQTQKHREKNSELSIISPVSGRSGELERGGGGKTEIGRRKIWTWSLSPA